VVPALPSASQRGGQVTVAEFARYFTLAECTVTAGLSSTTINDIGGGR
jgi:hypothetical protein